MDEQAHRSRYCRGCSYDLRDLAEHRCPECGRAFDPGDPRTYRKRPRKSWWVWARRGLLVLVSLAVILAGTFLVWRAKKIGEYEREQAALKTLMAAGAIPGQKYHVDAPEWLRRYLGSKQWLVRETSLALPPSEYSRAQLEQLHAFSHLAELEFIASASISRDGLQALQPIKGLRELNMRGLRLACDPLPEIEARFMTGLEVLLLSRVAITDRGLQELEHLPNLRELELHDTNLKSYSLIYLRRLGNLQVLAISGNPGVDDPGIRHLAGLRTLRKLDLMGTAVTDEVFDTLQRLPELEVLVLSDTLVTDACIPKLTKLSGLRSVCFSRRSSTTRGLTQKGITDLRWSPRQFRVVID